MISKIAINQQRDGEIETTSLKLREMESTRKEFVNKCGNGINIHISTYIINY